MEDFRMRGHGRASCHLRTNHRWAQGREVDLEWWNVRLLPVFNVDNPSGLDFAGIYIGARIPGRGMLHQSFTSPGRGLRGSTMVRLLPSHLIEEPPSEAMYDFPRSLGANISCTGRNEVTRAGWR